MWLIVLLFEKIQSNPLTAKEQAQSYEKNRRLLHCSCSWRTIW